MILKIQIIVIYLKHLFFYSLLKFLAKFYYFLIIFANF